MGGIFTILGRVGMLVIVGAFDKFGMIEWSWLLALFLDISFAVLFLPLEETLELDKLRVDFIAGDEIEELSIGEGWGNDLGVDLEREESEEVEDGGTSTISCKKSNISEEPTAEPISSFYK